METDAQRIQELEKRVRALVAIVEVLAENTERRNDMLSKCGDPDSIALVKTWVKPQRSTLAGYGVVEDE